MESEGRNAHVNHDAPTEQDFRATFGLGDDDMLIGTQDADGVALAAIQGVNAKPETQLAAQRAEIAEVRRAVTALLDATASEQLVAQRLGSSQHGGDHDPIHQQDAAGTADRDR